MPSTYTPDLRLELQANGENSSTWGTKLNSSIQQIEDAIAGMIAVATTGGDTTLTTVNGGTDQSRYAMLKITGTLVSNSNIIVPDASKEYLIWNATSGAYTVTVKTAAGSGVVVTQGATAHVFCDATNVLLAAGGSAQAEVFTNKTLTSPAINGTVTTTGLTLPALTLGGAITGNSQNVSGLGTLGCGAITSTGAIAGTSLNIGTGALTAGAGSFTTLGLTSTGSTTADGFRLTLGSEARAHYIYSSLATGRDLTIAPWRSLKINTGNGMAEGILWLNGYEHVAIGAGSAYTERVRVDATGLTVTGSGTFNNAGSATQISLGRSGDNDITVGSSYLRLNNSTDSVKIFCNTVERGSFSPSGLSVAGGVLASGNMGAAVGVATQYQFIGTSALTWRDNGNTSSLMTLDASGNLISLGQLVFDGGLAVGTNSLQGSKIYFGGAVISAGAGTYPLKWNSSTGIVTYDTSSRLVKENVVDCPYGLDEILKLKPRKYHRIDDDRDEIGFVGDEFVEVMPEFVPMVPKSLFTKDESDTELIAGGVNYDKLTAVLTKAIHQLTARLEALEAK